jgi:S1-C subfamily serine protease
MTQRAIRWLGAFSASAVFAACLGLLSARSDEPPDLPRGEIAKRGREATAFLEVGPGRSATAFCVHPSGLFVTNDHVVQNQSGGGIKIVVNSGTLEQKVYSAKVVRRDNEADLALLRAERAEALPALPLGSAGDLEELMEVVVFGFPFGRGPTTRGDEFPSISVNRGAISSLRRKDGRLERIQLNAEVNPGNSGGPLLNVKGRVVGVIVGRVQANFGAGVDLAIPVNVLDRFLGRPEITFTAEKTEAIGEGESIGFRASVVQVIPTEGPLALQLVFAAGTRDERRVPMAPSGNEYQVRTVPFPAPKDSPTVDVVVRYADGSVQGRTADRPIRVGARDVKLTEVGVIRLSPRPEVRTADGRTLDGELSPPGELTVSVGGQPIRLDLRNAVQIETVDAGSPGAVSCTVVVQRGEEELGRVSLPIYLAGAVRPSFEALRTGRFIRPSRSTSPVTYLRVESAPGDYIGQGKSYSYEKDDLKFQASAGGVRCQVGSAGGWTLLLGAGQGRNLDVGEYRDAKRHPFSGESPGIEFTGNGRGCNAISGEFRVWEFEMKGNTVVRLAVDFVLRCEARMNPLVGMVRFNSTYY